MGGGFQLLELVIQLVPSLMGSGGQTPSCSQSWDAHGRLPLANTSHSTGFVMPVPNTDSTKDGIAPPAWRADQQCMVKMKGMRRGSYPKEKAEKESLSFLLCKPREIFFLPVNPHCFLWQLKLDYGG